ncbi:MAG: ribonuclease H-like domain-containing protein [Piptocephalis tieghemiana]|nr:MAG: ribonuclease H-like domain-containing protein [Piptocephalis tieghemiana]
MEVTRDEFTRLLPSILADLEACDFCAIDAEFTGFTTESAQSSHFDSLDDRYTKYRTIANTYQICQLGICPFIYHPEEGIYKAHPYNFYVLPRKGSTSNDTVGASFSCQALSLEFLRRQGFDLNRWIWYGIGYMTKEEEAKRNRSPQELSDVYVDPPGQIFLQNAQKSIRLWLCLLQGSSAEQYLNIPTANGYQKRLIFQHVRQNFPETLDVKSMGGFVQIRLMVPSQVEKRQLMQEKARKDWIIKDIGLRHLLDALVESGKPLVGHNMILDILFIYNTFHSSSPLPPQRSDFVQAFHSLHPILFDTKWLAEQSDISWTKDLDETSIQALMNNRPNNPPVQVQFGPGFSRYAGQEKAHEAGYDAYATGLLFLDLTLSLPSSSFSSSSDLLPLFPVKKGNVNIPTFLQAHLNHLYLIKLGSIPFVLGLWDKVKLLEAQLPKREEKRHVLLLTLPQGSQIDFRTVQWALANLGSGVDIQPAGEDRWWVTMVNPTLDPLTVQKVEDVIAQEGVLPSSCKVQPAPF